MKNRPATGVRFTLCVLSTFVLVAGCGGGKQEQPVDPSANPGEATVIPTVSAKSPSPSRSPRIPGGLPDPHSVDQKDATELSRAALITMYTADSTVDTGLRDAKVRASRYFTSDYAAKIKAEPAQHIPADWQRHRAYSRVRLRPIKREAGAPSDGPTAAYREWKMTTFPTGRDHWRGTSRTYVVFMTLARSSAHDPWRVSDATVRSAN